MKKSLLLLVAVFSFAGAFAYEIGDYVYTANSKYKVDGDNMVPAITAWTGTEDLDTWSIYEDPEGKVSSALQSLDGSEGSTLLRTNIELTSDQCYIVTLKIRGVATTVSSVTPGTQNEINAFVTNGEPSADGVRTGTENVDYYQVATSQSILNDEWAEISFAFVDTRTEATIGSDAHYLNITIGRLTTGTIVADAEVRPVKEVYDTRKMDRKVAFVQKLLADENFAEAESDELAKVIKKYQEADKDDIAKMEDIEASLNEAEAGFIESVATNINENFEKINITSVTKINNGDGGGSVNQGCWSTSGGASRWGHGSGSEWINYAYPGSYALPWGCITAKPTGGIILPPGKYMFMCDLFATQYLKTRVDGGYYGHDSSVHSEGSRLFIGNDTIDIETPLANEEYEAERYYIISEIEEGEEFSAGAWFPGFDPYGGIFNIGHVAVYAFGDVQESVERQEAWNPFIALWDATTISRDSLMSKLNIANYPWEQDSLIRAIHKWDYLYTNILDNWVTANGEDTGVATNDQLKDWAVTQGYEYEEGVDPEWMSKYPLVQAYQHANNYVQDQNQPFINLKAKVAEAKDAVVDPYYATVDPTDLNNEIANAETLITSVSAEKQHDEFIAELEVLTAVLQAYYNAGASFYRQTELTVINPNFTYKIENLEGGTATTDASGAWNSYTTNSFEYWRLGKSEEYEGGGRACIWRGWTGNPAGSLTQDIIVTKAGHYNFKCQAYCTGDNARIISSVRHINIQTETQKVWDEDEQEWVDDEVEVGRDTTYISGIKLVFGPADAVEIDSLDVWTSGENVGDYTPQWFEMEYDKATDGEETLRFGMDALGVRTYKELGIYNGNYSPNAYGFGSVHVTYAGPSEKYYEDSENPVPYPTSPDEITCSDFYISRGETKTFGIKLSNQVANYVGFQMDLTLPEGLTINKTGCSLSERITDENQELTIGKQSENVYRLTSTSLDLTPISGTSGDLITVSVTASNTYQSGNATISNIQFATNNSKRFTMNDVTLGINFVPISFDDENVKALCVANWDTNGDDELDEAEAAAVTDLAEVFKHNRKITSFDELRYFTGLTSIGEYEFEGCSDLTSIIIPKNVTSIGNMAFAGCPNFISIKVDSDNKQYDSRDNCNAIIETKSNTLIAGCKNTIIPNSVTIVGISAFYGCSNLVSITIPESVTSIGEDAFSDCSGLTSITIPESVTSIGESAFGGCSGLTSIMVDSENTVYDSRDNCNAIIEKESNTLIAGCNNSIIPDGITSIGNDAFRDCYRITSITIPESVTNIGDYVFWGCFRLTSITIPNSVTTIAECAFGYNPSLTSVVVNNSSPFEIFESTFKNTLATLYVPKDSKTAYAAADYWKDFKAIKEYPDPDVNQDGYVDVLDVVDVARFVVGTPSESFDPFLADLNSSGDVNIADAVVLVNEIAGDVNWAKSLHASDFSDGILTLTKNADQSLSFSLEDSREYTAFQFDLMVPEGTDVEKMMLNTLRQQQHQLLYNKLENGHYRVAALSTSNNVFNGNDGELLNIAVSGTGSNEVSISDIHFIDVRGNDYKFADITPSEVTGMEELTPAISEGNVDIYDLQGRKMNASSLTKGIYIIGKKKVMIKY